MYSRNKGNTEREVYLTPPPGYDGSRFRKRSDGRDDAYPPYAEDEVIHPHRHYRSGAGSRARQGTSPVSNKPIYDKTAEECSCSPSSGEEETCSECRSPSEEGNGSRATSFDLLKGLGSEELLLIALIILLAQSSNGGSDTVLILALLLCIS
ncbi:MAG: hypothetical protein IJD22_07550 [Clostridia bacterium]|nr:hypothetical protein [Clostridia bacterium]